MKIFKLAFMVLVVSSLSLAEETLTFKNKGDLVKVVLSTELHSLAKPIEVTVDEPLEAKERTYLAYPVNALLTSQYGEKWKQSEEILFTCSDGFQAPVPTSLFVDFPAYLAFKRKDQPEFSLINLTQNKEKVDLSPFYLVWDNRKFPKVTKEGTRIWPYQVTTLDLIRFADRFPNLAPPDSSSPAVKKGFLVFRNNCMTCHSINGEGGNKAPELNYPASVTEYMKESWLRKWIINPTSLRFNTNMPAFKGTGEPGEIDHLIAYLKVMAKNKKAPVTAESR